MDSGKILGAMSQVLAEQENETRKQIEELELTIKMQKGIIKDLEKRIGEEKRLCAEWRKRALLAEKAEDKKLLKFKQDLAERGGPIESRPCEEEQTVEEQAPELRPYVGDADALYRRTIRTFGARAQKLKCVEELLELALALVRDQLGRTDRKNISEERADVGIMLYQLVMIQNDDDDVTAWVNEKLCRLFQTVLAEEEKNAERLRRYADD